MRFFAAMMVVLLHTGSAWAEAHKIVPRPIVTFLLNGFMGVTFFLVLSGFLLQGLYRSRFGKPGSVANFFLARMARIYPVYLLSLIAILPFVISFDASGIPQFLMAQHWLPTEFSGFENWNMPAWTLSCEVFFYLFFPLVAPRMKTVPNAALVSLGGACVLWMLVTWAPLVSNNSTVPAAWMRDIPVPFLRAPEFLLGVVVGELGARGVYTRIPPSLIVIVLIAVMCSTSSGYAAAVMAISSALLCSFFASGRPSVVGRVLSLRLIVLLGGASYSIYLLHLPIHFTLEALGDGSKLVMALQFPMLIAIGVAVFVLFEEPMRERIRKVAHMRESAQAELLARS